MMASKLGSLNWEKTSESVGLFSAAKVVKSEGKSGHCQNAWESDVRP